MSGITGWIDFGRDLSHELETVRAMTGALSSRGPDGEGIWSSQHAALGHRRLAVIDPSAGSQPMVEGGKVLLYNGEIYNHRDLRRELSSAGHVFKTESDTEVVLRAYLQWGLDMLERLNGMFAFAIWDEDTQELTLARDRLGAKPLYYYPLEDGLLFGSEPKAILANPLAQRAVDPMGLCGFLTFTNCPEGRTLFRNLFDLPPAHLARFSREGHSLRRYWALEARPHEDDLPTTIANVRGLLEEIVTLQLVSDAPSCLLLSGGLDSSVLAALAQRAIEKNGGEKLRSYGIDFEGYVENFEPDSVRETADQPFARQVADHVGCVHRDFTIPTEQLLDPAIRSSVLNAWDMPNALGDMDISLYLLFKNVREHAAVALSGEGADALFAGSGWAHDPAVFDMPIFPWMAAEINRGTGNPLGMFSKDLIDELKPIEYVLALYNESLSQVPRLPGEEGEQARRREFAYFDLTVFLRRLLERNDRTSMANGVEVRFPYCDHRLVQYVFNAPWSIKKCDGREKSILRKAAEDLLPEPVLLRRKSVFPATQDNSYDMALGAELKRILDGGEDDPIRPRLDIEETRAVIEQSGQPAVSPTARGRHEMAIWLNGWLKQNQLDLTGI
jgi:asparagine synthase (glutamine-hydrolysing)